jgi:coenzyme F420-0:L-glutamate ligase/coenzyme F420-1:gamma-L-glutamate ligase
MPDMQRSPLTLTPLEGIPMIQEGDDLTGIIIQALEENRIELVKNDILVFAQKVVSKAEGRKVDLRMISPSPKAVQLGADTEKDPRVVELILAESKEILRTRPGLIIVEHRHGFVCANAGIDHSNVPADDGSTEDFVLLLPEDPDLSAQRIRSEIEGKMNVRIGVVIIDSHGRAWRNGTVGVSIGFSGVPGLVDLRGKPDLYGYKLRITQVGVVDELAAGASLLMGQADEGYPVIHVRGFPYPLREGAFKELPRDQSQDLFR